MKIISSISLSVSPLHTCAWEGYETVEIFMLITGLTRCGGSLYKPVTLNFALFTWNSFLFIHSIISIWVTGTRVIGLPDTNLGYLGTSPSPTVITKTIFSYRCYHETDVLF